MCYILIQRFGVTCFIAGQIYTEECGTVPDVIYRVEFCKGFFLVASDGLIAMCYMYIDRFALQHIVDRPENASNYFYHNCSVLGINVRLSNSPQVCSNNPWPEMSK